MKIQPETLRKLRKERGLSQQELADEAHIDKKTVAHIEGGKGEPRVSTVERIAQVLRVDPQVLVEGPESKAVRDVELEKLGLRRAKFILDNETLLAYDLVGVYYGVDMQSMLNVGPLLFALLAEQFWADRRRCAEEEKKVLEDCKSILESSTLLDLTNIKELVEARASDYEDSLDKSRDRRGLFRYRWKEMFEDYAGRNPFSDFLRQLAEKLDPDDELNFWTSFGADGFLNRSILMNFRKELTDGSARADYALSHGYVRIAQIPEELRGEDEDVTSRRVEWLESKVPTEDWEDSAHFRHAALATKESSEKGDENV